MIQASCVKLRVAAAAKLDKNCCVALWLRGLVACRMSRDHRIYNVHWATGERQAIHCPPPFLVHAPHRNVFAASFRFSSMAHLHCPSQQQHTDNRNLYVEKGEKGSQWDSLPAVKSSPGHAFIYAQPRLICKGQIYIGFWQYSTVFFSLPSSPAYEASLPQVALCWEAAAHSLSCCRSCSPGATLVAR